MSATYPCQCCGCDYSGAMRWAPSGLQQGRTVLMKMVCGDCFDSKCAMLNNEIWKDSQQLHTTRCNMCNCDGGFGTEGPYYAPRRPLETGEWVPAPVCCECFGKYKDCCAKETE